MSAKDLDNFKPWNQVQKTLESEFHETWKVSQRETEILAELEEIRKKKVEKGSEIKNRINKEAPTLETVVQSLLEMYPGEERVFREDELPYIKDSNTYYNFTVSELLVNTLPREHSEIIHKYLFCSQVLCGYCHVHSSHYMGDIRRIYESDANTSLPLALERLGMTSRDFRMIATLNAEVKPTIGCGGVYSIKPCWEVKIARKT